MVVLVFWSLSGNLVLSGNNNLYLKSLPSSTINISSVELFIATK